MEIFCDIMGIPGHSAIGAILLLLGGGLAAALIAFGSGNLIAGAVLFLVSLIVSVTALLRC